MNTENADFVEGLFEQVIAAVESEKGASGGADIFDGAAVALVYDRLLKNIGIMAEYLPPKVQPLISPPLP